MIAVYWFALGFSVSLNICLALVVIGAMKEDT